MSLVETLVAGFSSLNVVLVGTFAPGGPEPYVQVVGVTLPIVSHLILEARERSKADVEEVDEVVG